MLLHLNQRQEFTYLIVAGIFLGTLGIVNILGLSRFIEIGGFVIPLGVLPYPLTFLCIDLISELFGKERANRVVWIGFGLNLWLFFLIWVAGILPPAVEMPVTSQHPDYPFFTIRTLTMSNITGSMIAYLVTQLLGVRLFHFCKKLTNGKHLWLRNNLSTLISQGLDTLIVISIAYFLAKESLPLHNPDHAFATLGSLMLSSYGFKALAALADTLPLYLGVTLLKKWCASTELKKQPVVFDSSIEKEPVLFDR